MPRLNNSNVATTGYLRSWFDENRTIFQDCSTGVCKVVLSDGTVLQDPASVIYVYARDGKWVAEVPGKLIGSWGEIPGASLDRYIDPIGPDGSLVYKRVRDSFGPWGFHGGPDFGGDCFGVQNHGGGKVTWMQGDWVLHSNFGYKHDGLRVYSHRKKGDDFLYQSADTSELVLNGRVIGEAGNYHRPDFSRTSNGFLVVWSPVEGEPTVTELLITFTELAQKRVVGAAPPPPPDPKPDPKPEPDPMPTAPELKESTKKIIRDIWNAKIGKALEGKTAGHEAAGATSDVLFEALYFAAKDDPRIGMYPKSSGTNYKGWGEDIILIKEDGRVWWKDCVVNISTLNPELHLDGFNLSTEPDKWKTPPEPDKVDPLPDPLPDPVPNPKPEVDALKKRVKELEALLLLKEGEITDLRKEIEDWKRAHEEEKALADSLRGELEKCKAQPAPKCECDISPSWMARLGAKCVPRGK